MSRAAVELDAVDQALFEVLRQERQRIASKEGLPPYVIFHDATLRDMAREKPSNEQELLSISGVGRAKLDRYGAAFLAEIEHSIGA